MDRKTPFKERVSASQVRGQTPCKEYNINPTVNQFFLLSCKTKMRIKRVHKIKEYSQIIRPHIISYFSQHMLEMDIKFSENLIFSFLDFVQCIENKFHIHFDIPCVPTFNDFRKQLLNLLPNIPFKVLGK